jgi:Ankyrin repeats (many copies)
LTRNTFILNEPGVAQDRVDDSEERDEDEDEAFVYPGNPSEQSHPEAPVLAPVPQPQTAHPSPAQLESLCAAASSGDLSQLKRLFRNATEGNNVEPFSLANETSARTGLTAMHAAASRGHLDIVKWREYTLGMLVSALTILNSGGKLWFYA